MIWGADVAGFFFLVTRTLPLAEFRLYLPSMHRADMPVSVSIRSILYELLATSESRCPRGLRYVQYSTTTAVPVYVLGDPPIGIFE